MSDFSSCVKTGTPLLNECRLLKKRGRALLLIVWPEDSRNFSDVTFEGILMESLIAKSRGSADELENVDLLSIVYRNGDKLMVGVLWFLWAVSLGFCFLYGTWILWAIVATAVAGIGTMAARTAPGSLATRCIMASALMVFSALLIHQAHGMTEVHFGIFVLLAFLLYYRDWKPIILAAGLIAVHHAGFYYLQASGVPVYVFAHTGMFSMVLIHAAYVVVEAGVLVIMAVSLRQETDAAATLAVLGSRIAGVQEIDLDPGRVEGAGLAGRGVAGFLEQIGHAIQEASAVAVSIRSASAEMRAATQDMVELSSRQHSDIGRVVSLIQEINEVAGQVAGDSRRVSDEADGSAAAASETEQAFRATSDSIEHLVNSVEQTAQQMTRLEEATDRIGKIVEMIGNIAGQTNLLALNASIEAARAGDAGRGFSVVAQEVRRLSESTQNSAQEIQKVVSNLREEANSARDMAEQSRKDAEQGSAQMASASREFRAIAEKLPHFASSLRAFQQEMSRQRELMQQAGGTMDQLSSFVEKSSTRVNEIRSSGESLDVMSERLYDSVRRFRRGEQRFVE
jgi:methyl-accepting chemotaxis protein